MNKFLFLLISLSFVSLAQGQGAGMRFDVSQLSLNYASQVGKPLVEQQLRQMKISPTSGKEHGFHYTVDSIKVVGASLGGITALMTKNGLSLSITGLSLTLTANWRYKSHFVSDHGTMKVKVSGSSSISALVSMQIAHGRPSCGYVSGSTHLDHFSFDMHGSPVSWLYDAIIGAFKGNIKSQIVSETNKAIRDAVNGDLNKSLQDVDPIVNLGLSNPFDNFTANFSMTQLVMDDGLLLLEAQGTSSDGDAPSSYPGKHPPLPAPNNTALHSKMMTLTITPLLVNSGLWEAYTNKLLSKEITQADISSGSLNPLNTTYFGVFVPDMYKQYPNQPMTVVVSATTPPTLGVSKAHNTTLTRAVFDAQCDLMFMIVTNETKFEAFTLTCPAEFAVLINIENQTLLGNVSLASCEVEVKDTNFGNIHAALLKFTVDSLLTSVVIPQLNKGIAKGLPIPTMSDVTFTDTVLHSPGDSSLQIQTNLEYKPSQATLAARAVSQRRRTIENMFLRIVEQSALIEEEKKEDL